MSKAIPTKDPMELHNRIPLIEGCIFTAQGHSVPFWPVEVSQFNLIIFTQNNLHKDEILFLRHENISIELLISEVIPQYNKSPFSMITCASRTVSENVERILRQIPDLKRWNPEGSAFDPIRLHSSPFVVRSARFETNRPLDVSARTFGTKLSFQLKLVNVSKTGLLLEQTTDAVPFILNSLIEISIDPKLEVFEESIPCVCKVVRAKKVEHSPNGDRTTYGLQIIDIEPRINERWCRYVEQVERERALK